MNRKSMVLHRKESERKIISGFSALIIRLLLKANILLFAIMRSGNPVSGYRILTKIKKHRREIQGSYKARKYVKSGHRYFFSENIPGWPSAAFNGFIRSEIAKFTSIKQNRSLSTVIFAITSRCRLGCEHCCELNNPSPRDSLSFEDLDAIIRKLNKYGVRHIQLSGGEPLERFDDLIRLIVNNRKGTDFWLLTSGFGLTPERAFILKKAGLTGADVSLDHWNETEHNLSRKNSRSFYWVKEAMKNCLSAGLATSLSLCAFRTFVSKDNLGKYSDLAKEWGAGFIRILEPMETEKWKGKDISLGQEETGILKDFFIDMNSSDEFLRYPIVSYPGYHQRITGCQGAGNRYLYIDPAGNIHACPFCRQSVGNAVTDDLEDVMVILKIHGCHRFSVNTSNLG